MMRVWRPDDEALLVRLEDEVVLARLLEHHAGPAARTVRLHPRAAGLVASARALPGAEAAMARAAAGDPVELVRLLEAGPMTRCSPELLHHLGLYFMKVAGALETASPIPAANAWKRALAAFLALADERSYLDALARALASGTKLAPSPDRLPLELLAELGRRAEAGARERTEAGRAALLALGWIDDALGLAGTPEATAPKFRLEAQRRRNAALETALAPIGEALDDASMRGAIAEEARGLLLPALAVWAWSERDDAVEHFVIERLAPIGWELYRASGWAALKALLDPFRGLFDNLGRRIERDPHQFAYAAPCAQMYVFLADVDTSFTTRLEHAERAVRICPTHRNGRLVLAALLCEEAQSAMRAMVLFARRAEIERVEKLLERAERLYPTSTELPSARAALERLKKGRIAL